MRTKLLILAAACSLAASAQQVEITSRQQLLKGTESGICNPVLSADGQKLLFTHADYKGLKLYDFSSDVTTTIATDDMAGFHPSFSRDGKSVYFLSQTREDMRGYREVKAYNLEARTSMAVTEKARGMQAPVAVDGGFAAVSDNGRKLKADRKGGTYVYARGAQLIVVRNGKEQQLQPVATDHTYMWESLSPDGNKILFYAGGKGAYVCDLEGNVLASLGRYAAPRWAGNDYVVAENATVDGHQYESCQIMLLKADGSFKYALTKPETMTMNPSASANGSRIAYNTIDGRLFVMDIKISE